MKPNRYIKAMEIGLAHEKDGISYFDLVDELQKQLGYEFGVDAESTFFNWFADNFSHGKGKFNRHNDRGKFFKYLKDKKSSSINPTVGNYTDTMALLKKMYWLDGDANKQYLDYVELKESRKAATQAKRQSNISIWLAIAAIIISAFLGLVSLYSTQNVKIVEGHKLEIENSQLKDELYKAEMMLRAYEADSVPGS